MSNLRIVQWQANQRKKNRLEFLVPWWDLQHGCSINQFLSAFASKNADFRYKSPNLRIIHPNNLSKIISVVNLEMFGKISTSSHSRWISKIFEQRGILLVFVCRKRSFALFFAGGEDEAVAREHVGECRPWPQQFREKKAQAGLAAAAIVTVPKDNEEVFRTCIASQVLVVPDPPALSAGRKLVIKLDFGENNLLELDEAFLR